MTFFTRSSFLILSIALVAMTLFIPDVTFAQGFKVCEANGCTWCHFIQLVELILKYLIFLAGLFAVILFIYAGFLLVTSAGNTGKVTKAKSIFLDALIGIIIILTAFMVVDLVMKTLVGENLLGGGPWNFIDCSRSQNPNVTTPVAVWFGNDPVYTTEPGGGGGGTTTLPPSANLAEAADRAFESRMSTAAGPDNGNKACVWAVNRMLESAGMAPFATDNVFYAEREIQGGRGESISQSQGAPGDIVIVSDGPRAHIGVCANQGCTQVINNSSSAAAVVNKSSPSMGYPTTPRFYRLSR